MYKEIVLKKMGFRSLMFVAIVSFQLLVFPSFAQIVGGTTGSLTWELDFSDSTLTITGDGTMPDYDYAAYLPNPAPWIHSRTDIATIIIGDGVKNIGDYAFASCWNLTSITLPNSITKIGEMAFGDCWNLTSITLPNSLTVLENGVFSDCSSLESITIPNGVTTIRTGAFHSCSALTFVIIPNSVITIEQSVFAHCSSLDSIICHANTPPATDSYIYPFSGVPTTIPVYVPCGSIASYQMAIGWTGFTNYQAIGGEPLPDIPENVTATQQDNVIEVSWKSTGASSYEIYRDNELLTTVSTTTYNDNNVANGVNYCYRINAMDNACASGLSTEVCEVFSNVGIVEKQDITSSLRIYPNPNTGKLTVVGSQLSETGGEVEIYNVVGQVVSASAVSPQSTEIEIDISGLSAGLYFLKVDGKTYKVVKE